MVNGISLGAYGNAIKRLWTGSCDVFIKKTEVNITNGRNESTETCVLRGEPCRLSFSTVSTTSENNEAALVKQVVKLFISKDVIIPEGSKIVVTQEGVTANYCHSGKPAVYSVHQELILEHFKEWA